MTGSRLSHAIGPIGSRAVVWTFVCLAALAVIAAYVLNFVPIYGWHLASSTESWAQFGEYIGGVFGMLAFIGVLWTIGIQQRQIAQLTRQAAADELQRICRDLASNIDQLLDRQIVIGGTTALALNARSLPFMTMRSVLELAADEPTPNSGSEKTSLVQAQHHGAITHVAPAVEREIKYLTSCLQGFQQQGGSLVIGEYYGSRYGEVIRRMVVLGYAEDFREWWLWQPQHRQSGESNC